MQGQRSKQNRETTSSLIGFWFRFGFWPCSFRCRFGFRLRRHILPGPTLRPRLRLTKGLATSMKGGASVSAPGSSGHGTRWLSMDGGLVQSVWNGSENEFAAQLRSIWAHLGTATQKIPRPKILGHGILAFRCPSEAIRRPLCALPSLSK